MADEDGETNTNVTISTRPVEESKVPGSVDEQLPGRKRRQQYHGSELPQDRKLSSNEQKTSTCMHLTPSQEKGSTGISIRLAPGVNKKPKTETPLQKKTGIAASAFNESDEEEEEEEMPKAARMRMRNLGRETPTSAGPNSFNKGKKGFTHHQKVWEKHMKIQPPSAKSSRKET